MSPAYCSFDLAAAPAARTIHMRPILALPLTRISAGRSGTPMKGQNLLAALNRP